MKKYLSLCLVLIIFLSVASAKTGFEYGGTKLFLENQQYQDGYDDNGDQLTGVNKYYTQRVYMTGYYHVNDKNKIRLTTDMLNGYEKHSNGYDYLENRMIVKYFYLESKGLFGFDKVKVGQIGTPWIGWEDKIWGNRFMSKSILDSHKITNSADRGLSVKNKIGNGEYEVALIGGEGYKVADRDGRYNLEGRLTQKLIGDLSASIGGGTGYKALAGDKKVESQQDLDEVKRRDFVVANVNYKAKKDLILSFTVYEMTDDKDGSLDGTITHGSGTSLTAVKSLPIVKGLDLVARLDNKDPNVLTAGNATQTSIVGAAYKVNNNLTVAYSNHADTNEYDVYSSDPIHTHYLQAQVKF